MLLAVLLGGSAALTARPAANARMRVCTNKACRKAGSLDTLGLLQGLASTVPPPPETPQGLAAATLQQAFAHSKIEQCGCLGGCGSGPNTVAEHTGQVFYDVYKPVTALALLQVPVCRWWCMPSRERFENRKRCLCRERSGSMSLMWRRRLI